MGTDPSAPSVLALLAEKNQPNSYSEAYYKAFLIKNEKELLHNIAELIKSANQKLEYEEDIAWQGFQTVNDIAPSDDEDEAVQKYRRSAIANLYVGLSVATKALTDRKVELEKLRREVSSAVNKIRREVRERRKMRQNNQQND